MHDPITPRAALWAGCAVLALCAAPALAQITPIKDSRMLNANAYYGGDSDTHVYTFTPFAPVDIAFQALAETKNGFASASSYQNSVFSSNYIFFAGTTAGSRQGDPGGSYNALSLSYFRVGIDGCLDYNLYTQVDPGDDVGSPSGFVEIKINGLTWFRSEAGESQLTGRVAPGEYGFEGKSSVTSGEEYLQGATYSMVWWCSPCVNPLIIVQPQDQMIECDDTVLLCAGTSLPPASLTFQWRRNLVPLADGGRISGASTSCLSIADACDADTGYYDVVVTSGPVSEPSRMAHVTVGGTSGIDPLPGRRPHAFTLGPAAPNPSGGAVACRFEAPQPFVAAVEICDAGGRLVRRLEPRLFAGSGSVAWDGRTAAGAPASPGVYFVRVAGAETSRFQRVAIVR